MIYVVGILTVTLLVLCLIATLRAFHQCECTIRGRRR